MDEHAEADRTREVAPDADPDASMSGVGVPSDRNSIDGLGYTGEGELEPDADEPVRPDDIDGTEDRPAG